jgi:integrase
MAGQIIRRGDSNFMVRVFLGRDPQTGKRRYHNKTVRGTKKDAQRYLTGVLRQIDLGTFVEPSSMTLGEYLDKWLESAARPRLAERTFADYKEVLGRYVREPLGSRRLSDVKPLDIQALYGGLTGRGLSARTVRSVHVVLSNALKQAVRWHLLTYNPAQNVELPKQARREMHALNPEEAGRFLAAAHNDHHGVILRWSRETGQNPLAGVSFLMKMPSALELSRAAVAEG